jgi:hypothetical protein
MAPGGLGVVCTVQEVPFHTSANVTSVPELFGWEPTATHELGLAQSSARRSPCGFRTLGVVSIDHFELAAG